MRCKCAVRERMEARGEPGRRRFKSHAVKLPECDIN